MSVPNPLSRTLISREYSDDEVSLSPEIRSIIRKKVSSYLHCEPKITSQVSKQTIAAKKGKTTVLPREFGEYSNIL